MGPAAGPKPAACSRFRNPPFAYSTLSSGPRLVGRPGQTKGPKGALVPCLSRPTFSARPLVVRGRVSLGRVLCLFAVPVQSTPTVAPLCGWCPPGLGPLLEHASRGALAAASSPAPKFVEPPEEPQSCISMISSTITQNNNWPKIQEFGTGKHQFKSNNK